MCLHTFPPLSAMVSNSNTGKKYIFGHTSCDPFICFVSDNIIKPSHFGFTNVKKHWVSLAQYLYLPLGVVYISNVWAHFQWPFSLLFLVLYLITSHFGFSKGKYTKYLYHGILIVWRTEQFFQPLISLANYSRLPVRLQSTITNSNASSYLVCFFTL